jgi:putative heme transporter
VHVSLSLLVVVLIFGFLFPKLADYGEVWQTIEAMTALEVATLLLVAVWNLVSYWPVLTAVQPGLRMREAAVSNLASTAVANTLPGGAALGVGATVTMQHDWGIPVADVARGGVVSGVWNNFVKLGMPIVALALVAVTGDAGPGRVTAAALGLIVLIAAIVALALLLKSDRLAARIGTIAGRAASTALRPLGRGPVLGWDAGASRFRTETIGLLEGRALRITAVTLGSHISLYLVLLVALRHVGVSEDEVSWVKVLEAFAFVRLLSAVPITPGGLGVVELGLTAAIGAGLNEAGANQVAAAVLLFRALTWFAPIPLGLISWLFWRSNKSWRHTVDERRNLAGAGEGFSTARPEKQPSP